ncbi:MAG: helix-turn-helix transcriptional regulator [Chloroflexota bacterium]
MMTRLRTSRPFGEYLEEQMQDAEFLAAYRALEPEFQVARQVIQLRLQRGLSQQELAEKVGTGQPNISRLERGTTNPSLHFLQKVAEALGAELEVTFTPTETQD